MIHGFVGGIYDYNNFQNELQLYKDFDVYTFTLSGHDKMIVSDVKYEDWLKDGESQIQFLINNGYKEIFVIGHSMGGVIAVHLASKYKEVKKLVLVAPAFRYFNFKDGKINIKGFNDTVKSVPELFKNMGKEAVIERITKTPIPTMIEFTKLVDSCQKDLELITCPVLTIHGLSDMVAPSESTELVYKSIKSNTNILYNVKKMTHDCFRNERNKEIREIIVKFLRNNYIIKKEIIEI